MSYDISLHVKVEGTDKYAMIAEPEYSSPTYNLGVMFRKCMDWDYSQSEQDKNGKWRTCYYPCDFVLERVEHGIKELRSNRKVYEQYNPPNGWGNINSAISALSSLRECILETSERNEIPLNRIYMSW